MLLILLLIRKAQNILRLRSHRDDLDHYFPECVLSSISTLGDKDLYWGKKTFMFKDILETLFTQRDTGIFVAGFLEPFMGTSALSFSKGDLTWGFQAYFAMKSFYVNYLVGLSFPGNFFGKRR